MLAQRDACQSPLEFPTPALICTAGLCRIHRSDKYRSRRECLRFRSPGVDQRSPVFQRALQLETIAFSPDVQTPPRSTPPESPCRGSGSSRMYDASRIRPQPATAICHGQSASCRALACGDQERKGLGMSSLLERGAGRQKRRTDIASKPRPRPWDELEPLERTRREEREQEQQVRGVGGTYLATQLYRYGVVKSTPSQPQFTTTKPDGSMSVTPAPLHVASEASILFDSGDMIMVARLLAHPECSLKVRVVQQFVMKRTNVRCISRCGKSCGIPSPLEWYASNSSYRVWCAPQLASHLCEQLSGNFTMVLATFVVLGGPDVVNTCARA